MATVEFKNHIFEWDDNKAELNQRKHGIRFETAVKVFSDENKLSGAMICTVLMKNAFR